MRTIKLTLAFDGAEFCGWQSQSQGERTVQGVLSHAVERLTGAPAQVEGAGRTDSGVHALGAVAAFRTACALPVGEILRALNALLPPDVRVLAAEDLPEGFHPRKHARSKTYRYVISTGPVQSPFARGHAWHIRGPLHVPAMARAAAGLVGEHDFAAYMASGSSVKSTQRRLLRLHVTEADAVEFLGMRITGGFVSIEAEGEGFLRHMVRNMAGTLAEVGLGKRPPDNPAAVLASLDRSLAGPTAPAHGLFLLSVSY